MMNFARAVKGCSPQSKSLKKIQDQALTELRRPLSQSEVDSLKTRFSLDQLVEKIQKVLFVKKIPLIYSKLFLVWLRVP